MSDRPAKDSDALDQRVWEQGWEDHQTRQLERLGRLPLSEKLVWLEEAQRLVNRLKSQPGDTSNT
jgi:hypothetical protein